MYVLHTCTLYSPPLPNCYIPISLSLSLPPLPTSCHLSPPLPSSSPSYFPTSSLLPPLHLLQPLPSYSPSYFPTVTSPFPFLSPSHLSPPPVTSLHLLPPLPSASPSYFPTSSLLPPLHLLPPLPSSSPSYFPISSLLPSPYSLLPFQNIQSAV